MLTNSVALSPLSIAAMLPHGALMLVLAQVSTSLPFASSTSKPPAPRVRVVPSVLGALPTMSQPLLSIIIAVLKPTPPGHAGKFCGSCANVVICFVAGL